MNLIKAHGGKGSRPFYFERLATFPPQADHVLVVLFFIRGRPGGCIKAPDRLLLKITKISDNHAFTTAGFKLIFLKKYKTLRIYFVVQTFPAEIVSSVTIISQKTMKVFSHLKKNV